jgi:hypothetical protein
MYGIKTPNASLYLPSLPFISIVLKKTRSYRRDPTKQKEKRQGLSAKITLTSAAKLPAWMTLGSS